MIYDGSIQSPYIRSDPFGPVGCFMFRETCPMINFVLRGEETHDTLLQVARFDVSYYERWGKKEREKILESPKKENTFTYHMLPTHQMWQTSSSTDSCRWTFDWTAGQIASGWSTVQQKRDKIHGKMQEDAWRWTTIQIRPSFPKPRWSQQRASTANLQQNSCFNQPPRHAIQPPSTKRSVLDPMNHKSVFQYGATRQLRWSNFAQTPEEKHRLSSRLGFPKRTTNLWIPQNSGLKGVRMYQE